jgi:putative flippase GtrA
MIDHRLARFAAVGMANTVVGLAIIYACTGLLDMGDVAANAIGYALAVLLGFALNKNWTFGYTGDATGALVRYLATLLAAYAANLAATLFALDVLRLDSYMAQAVGIAPYAMVGYVGSRLFAFAPRPS